ncbi:phage tail protein [Amycolatopsis sp. NPDC051102]|uniref:phage tail protein n=1 Tax=Amycolatopsis sp. NPDC051102 TaxID=3155163 RepID=UPI00342C7F4C
MRAGIPGLPSPHPIGEQLPAVYAEDRFVQSFTGALDEVLAPVLSTLDNFAGYLDPRLAPEDFVGRLAHWVALGVDESWSPAQLRQLVTSSVELHRWRGTQRGLAEYVRLLTGGAVEVTDSGGVVESPQPGAPLPDPGPPWVQVRVRVPDPARVDVRRLTATVVDAVPAHVRVAVEVLEG